jgi:L-ribulose-5-phosphate 3-epimerase
MKRTSYFVAALFAVLVACSTDKKTTESPTPENVTSEWKLGVALWTFHTFDFPGAIARIDSSGLDYVELNTFHRAGPELKDSLIGQLSPAGIEKLKAQLKERNLQVESVYLGGDSTFAAWKRQFDIAKQFNVKFVTAEPPIKLWDRIDSLAGAYNMKVAIHEHWRGNSVYWHPDTVLLAIQGHPNFGACADLGHWPKSGIDPVDGVNKLQGHIIAIHLKDIAAFNDPKLRDVPVGTGVVNFPRVFQSLKDHGFRGAIYIERDAEDLPSNLPSVMSTIEYYNKQIPLLK